MNYIAEINGFERWLETHHLPTVAQLLWYKLLYWSSRSGWPEWTQVDNRRLMVSLQIAREASLTENRDRLVNAGLVEYQKGRKGVPGRYRLISLCNSAEYTYNLKVQPEVYPVVQSVDIINNKKKQKQKRDPNGSPEKAPLIDYQGIVDLYHTLCPSYPRVTKLSDKRQAAIRARMKSGYTQEDFYKLFQTAEGSSFLKGKNNRNWAATFDWLIADSNMAKVLDGNYSDRGGQGNGAKDEFKAWGSHHDYYSQYINRG